eukprot:scaffold8626_cov225-Isochrysis_galbana.AAC.4
MPLACRVCRMCMCALVCTLERVVCAAIAAVQISSSTRATHSHPTKDGPCDAQLAGGKEEEVSESRAGERAIGLRLQKTENARVDEEARRGQQSCMLKRAQRAGGRPPGRHALEQGGHRVCRVPCQNDSPVSRPAEARRSEAHGCLVEACRSLDDPSQLRGHACRSGATHRHTPKATVALLPPGLAVAAGPVGGRERITSVSQPLVELVFGAVGTRPSWSDAEERSNARIGRVIEAVEQATAETLGGNG